MHTAPLPPLELPMSADRPPRRATVPSSRLTSYPCAGQSRPSPSPSRRASIAALLSLMLSGCADLRAAPRQAAEGRRNRPAGKQAPSAAAASPAPDYSQRADVRQFIARMAQAYQFDETALQRDFATVRYDPSVIRLISPPPVTFKRSWAVYRSRFLDQTRIDAGLRFWQAYAADIRRATERYGVPEEIIVGIIGVETIYGRITGNYRVLDALTILSFDYPRRADYFKGELEQFLLFTREDRIDPTSVLGSFAGAVGLPQFMPSSIRKYAVDFDHDGHIDLRNSPVDAIGSVAHFLAEHGWQPGEPVRLRALFQDEAAIRPLLAAGIEPRYTMQQLAQYTIASPDPVAADMKLALIDLPNGDGPTTYYLGTPNFYAITRYNQSSFYAMAVYELGETLRAARQEALAASQEAGTAAARSSADSR